MRHLGLGCFTLSLTTAYRRRAPLATALRVAARVTKQEGKKFHMTAEITSPDGHVIYSEATSLFIRAYERVPLHDDVVRAERALEGLSKEEYEAVLVKRAEGMRALYAHEETKGEKSKL